MLARFARLEPISLLPYAVAVLLAAVLYIEMSAGHPFNEDYAVYLQQAFNIMHPGSDMGIVHQLDLSMPLRDQSPLVYPPLLPLIYALPVYFAGYDLELFKVLQLLMLLAGLLLFCSAMLKWQYRPAEIAVSLLVFGFTFEIHRSINSISSDLPFIFFLFLALVLIDRFSRTGRIGWGAAAGAAIFLAMDMRTVGIALVPTLIWADIAAHRRLRPVLAAPIATLAGLWLFQRLLIGQSEAYGYILHYQFFVPVENLRQFYWSMVGPFDGTAIGGVAPLAFLALLAAAVIGIAEGIVRARPVALFITVYTALLLILPNFGAGARYIVPHILVFGAFACRGAFVMKDYLLRLWQIKAPWLPAAVSVLAVGLFLMSPRPFGGDRLPYGVATPPAQEAFAFLRSQVSPGAIVATSKFRSFHLFTGRRTVRFTGKIKPDTLQAWLQGNGVRYAVIKTSPRLGSFDYSDCPRHPLCGPDVSHPYAKAVFRNRDFEVLAVAGPAGAGPSRATPR